MTFESVDILQKSLATTVFKHTKDAKKAAGRALGTLVEVITFYLFKAWGFEHSLGIEKRIPEYGNLDITHNVEYAFLPILSVKNLNIENKLPLTAKKIWTKAQKQFTGGAFITSNFQLFTSDNVLRNACTTAQSSETIVAAFLDSLEEEAKISLVEQLKHPYAVVECKRVGVEEGTKKGPQTIEKAKQGAYVAKSISSLHKLRASSGELKGMIFKEGGTPYVKDYLDLLDEIVSSDEPELIRDFILTIGVVSNHGNWFTSEDHNKELKVLAQSYDWLLFLTDKGLSEFISEFLITPTPDKIPVQRAFLSSYSNTSKRNKFTKVQMDSVSDEILQSFFAANTRRIEEWFNIIAPAAKTMQDLHLYLDRLRSKDWARIHKK